MHFSRITLIAFSISSVFFFPPSVIRKPIVVYKVAVASRLLQLHSGFPTKSLPQPQKGVIGVVASIMKLPSEVYFLHPSIRPYYHIDDVVDAQY